MAGGFRRGQAGAARLSKTHATRGCALAWHAGRTGASAGGLPGRKAGGRSQHRPSGSGKPFSAVLRTRSGGPAMNRGLLVRAWRESWPATLLLGAVLVVVEAALVFILPKFG